MYPNIPIEENAQSDFNLILKKEVIHKFQLFLIQQKIKRLKHQAVEQIFQKSIKKR